MKKFFLSLVGCLFIVTAYAQNPMYTSLQKRERVFNLDGGKSFIKRYENELSPAVGIEEPAKISDFTILSEEFRYEDFSPAELRTIAANRMKNHYVRTSLGRKIILIAPTN